MLTLLMLLIALACGYWAYRAIRGGFERPQSERWTGYGIFGCILFVLVALSLLKQFSE